MFALDQLKHLENTDKSSRMQASLSSGLKEKQQAG